MILISNKIKYAMFMALTAITAASCAPPASDDFAADPTNGTGTTSASFSNYIIVANNTTRNVVLLDANGTFVKTLYQDGSATQTPYGLAMYDSENVVISIEGTDRAEIANLRTGTSSVYILDGNLSGTIRGAARLSGGDILIAETTGGAVERFTSGSTPTRVVSGGWPVALQTTPTKLASFTMTANYFVQCSTGSDIVAVYNNAGTLVSSATSAAPAPSLGGVYDVIGCDVGPNDDVVAFYSGANDGVRVYDSTLTTVRWTYQNASLIPNPRAVGIRKSGANAGYVIAVDNSNRMLELTSSGVLYKLWDAHPAIVVANEMLVVP